MRTLTYARAIGEAYAQILLNDPRALVIGRNLAGVEHEFSRDRMIDSPASENATTGLAALDRIFNQAANWSNLFQGGVSEPLVIRAVIGRGSEQGSQHSPAFHAMFMHVPGLKVVMPSTAFDAKGLLIAALEDPDPVLYIDDRSLHGTAGPVPEEMYRVEIGRAAVRRPGRDVTLVGISSMAAHCVEAAAVLAAENIDAEVIDLRSLKPWDAETVVASVRKTGHAIVADPGWRTAGASAEIAATITERAFRDLQEPVMRVTRADCPSPSEESPGAKEICHAVRRLVGRPILAAAAFQAALAATAKVLAESKHHS
jgi:pyruvate/2-oxoglutarate/acetoin dehydrogenase E1 component